MRLYLLLLSMLFSLYQLSGQTPIVTAGMETVLENETVSIPVSVQNFTNVVSIQFTLEWDPTVITYQNTGDYGLPGMSEFNFGEPEVANGRLTFVWFDGQVNGVTLPDDSVIFSVSFLAIGELGESSPISFISEPTPIQIGVIDGVVIEEVDGTFNNGEVLIISEVLQVETSTTNNVCFGESQGTITPQVTGGVIPYDFNWTGPDGFVSTATTLNNLVAGDYAVTITDQNGTTFNDVYTITEPSVLEVVTIQIQESDCNSPTGSITLDITGGTPDYNYDFGDGFGPDAERDDLAAGTYPVQIRDEEGCLLDTTIIIAQANGPEVGLQDDFSLCPEEDATLTAGPDQTLTYTWTLEGLPLSETTNEIMVNTPGTYTVNTTNAAGCTGSDEVEIGTSLAPELTLEEEVTFCTGDQTILTASNDPSLTYNWTLDSEVIAPTTNEITVMMPGLYAVTATNAAGCSATDEITVSQEQAPELALGNTFALCPDEQATLTAGLDATLTYSWTLNGELLTETTNEIVIDTPGTYSVSTTNAAGCTAIDEVEVTAGLAPELTLAEEATFCTGDEAVLTANNDPSLNYSWTLDGEAITPTNNEITVMMPGLYAVTATNAAGCSAIDEIVVNEAAAPELALGNAFSLCPEEEANLIAGPDATLVYTWLLDNQPLPETTNELTINTPGNYTVSTTNAAGCTATDEVTINAAAAPELDLGDDVGICPDETAILQAGPDPTFVYNWTLDEQPIPPTTNTIEVTETGVYSVSASSDAGCTATDEIVVGIAILPLLDLGADTSICPKTTILLLADEDLVTFNWTLNGSPVGTGASELPASDAGEYVLEATTIDGCDLSDTILIDMIPFETEVGPVDTTIFAGEPLTLFATGGIAYNWTGNVEFSCDNCPNPEVTPELTTTFQVDITSDEGCERSVTFVVNVEEAPEVLVDLVNFISPNGDGKNDVLIFRGLENYMGNQLTIYNRWGDLLFSKPNYQLDGEYWDGTLRGQPLPPGIYFYVLNIDVASKPIKSSLTIVID